MIEIIATIDAVNYTIPNLGIKDATYVIEKAENQMYFRKSFNGELLITGDLFDKMLELLIIDDCTNVDVEIYQDGVLEFSGFFNTTSGEFDLDKCVFFANLLPYDDYTDYVARGDEMFDIFDMGTRESVVFEYFTGNITYAGILGGSCISIKEILTYLANEIGSHTFQSDFFDLATNYATNTTNLYKDIFIAQKSDIKRVGSTEPVRSAMISFNQLMSILRNMMNLYYFIEDGVFKLEHVSFFANSDYVDIRTETASFNKFKYDTQGKYKFETFRQMDYGEYQIIYDTNCVKQQDNELVRTVEVNNDISKIAMNADRGNSDAESDSGWVFIATRLDTGVYYARPFDMMVGNLAERFFWHNASHRTSRLGAMLSVRPDKFQDIQFSFCNPLDTTKYYRTTLADRLKVFGEIQKAEYNVYDKSGTLTLGYGFQFDGFYPATSVTIVQDSTLANDFRLYATFSDTTPPGSTITVDWNVYDNLGLIQSSGTETWTVSEVLESTFTPNWDSADLDGTGWCVEITFTMDFVLQSFTQPAFLIC